MPLVTAHGVNTATSSDIEAPALRKFLAHGLLVAVLLSLAALRFCPPSASRFYPQCPIHYYLGLLCPGCGATRAVAALLHGQLFEALRLNALAIVLLPFAVAAGVQCYRRALQPGRFQWPQLSPAAACYLFAVATVFAIARNIL